MPLKTASTARIPIELDDELLRALDRATRQTKQSRSSLICEALREHLAKLDVREKEEREREAYARQPQTEEELSLCDAEAAWPPE